MRTDVTTLTYGVELETTIPTVNMQANGWTVGSYTHGAAIPNHAFDGHSWLAKSDGSIRAHYPHTGCEVVSPILRGVEGLRNVKEMTDKLKSMGAKVNASCGFHVHVGWSGNAKQLRRLVCLVAQHEKALFAATGTTRREGNQYTRSIKQALKPLETMRNMNALQIVAAHQARFHVLNLHNLAIGKPTVEFRVFAGTINFTKIAAYVALCLGLVQRALDGREIPKWDYTKTAKQAEQKDGAFAMMRLMCSLNWRTLRGNPAMGILVGDSLPTRVSLRRMMLKLAKKYDESVTARNQYGTV
jgi:hypothetical protein